jgi:anti-sigma factor RsiW
MNHQGDDIHRHPTEDQLMELAINHGAPEHIRHVEQCAECARMVREFREVSRRVRSLEEREVPEPVALRIMEMTRHGTSRVAARSLGALITNPFLIALAVAIVVILLYFLVGMEVFREP